MNVQSMSTLKVYKGLNTALNVDFSTVILTLENWLLSALPQLLIVLHQEISDIIISINTIPTLFMLYLSTTDTVFNIIIQ